MPLPRKLKRYILVHFTHVIDLKRPNFYVDTHINVHSLDEQALGARRDFGEQLPLPLLLSRSHVPACIYVNSISSCCISRCV